MTLHCKKKTKNINLFLSKDQLLSEAATDYYTGDICNVRKCGPSRLGDWYTGLGAQTLVPKKVFQVFFLSYISTKKYVEVAISDFTMQLIISKWLRIQKCRQKRKAMRKERRNCQRKCFIHLTT